VTVITAPRVSQRTCADPHRRSCSDPVRRSRPAAFAALNALHGTVIGSCLDQHRHEEFLKFLRTVDRAVPEGPAVHMILDNYATHKHQDFVDWLVKHPRFQLHFTPTSSSWLNLVERWFCELTGKALRPGVFHSVPDLIASIEEYVLVHKQRAPTPRLDRHRRIHPDQSPPRPSCPRPRSQSMTRHTIRRSLAPRCAQPSASEATDGMRSRQTAPTAATASATALMVFSVYQMGSYMSGNGPKPPTSM
jgi:hypothetical protein